MLKSDFQLISGFQIWGGRSIYFEITAPLAPLVPPPMNVGVLTWSLIRTIETSMGPTGMKGTDGLPGLKGSKGDQGLAGTYARQQ